MFQDPEIKHDEHDNSFCSLAIFLENLKAAKNFIIKYFDLILTRRTKKSWCQAVLDDILEVQNDLHCTTHTHTPQLYYCM